uniref:NACHT domain-containing protein n=1 Tax=Hucho hucho TaxID=62062 RepID=A0A4W5KA43_9TELE
MKGNKAKGSFDIRRREASRMRIQEEIHRHVNHGHTLENKHVLREGFLGEMRRAVEKGSSLRPILLLGPPGWGKSTTMARLAHLAPSWITGAVKVLVCFVGLTGESRNVRLVLQNLCVQLAETYSHHTDLSEGLPQLVNEFHSLLGQVRADSPVIVVLDGIDALSEEHGADLSWLSTPLPPHVHLILSATTDSACAHTLQKSVQPTVLSLPPLSPDDITKALEHQLQTDHRRLQDWQFQLLLQACLSCPSPLYLEAVYAESVLWRSFSPQGSLGLPPDLGGLYVGLLACLERAHGEQLVGRAAAVISLSRGGVTEE